MTTRERDDTHRQLFQSHNILVSRTATCGSTISSIETKEMILRRDETVYAGRSAYLHGFCVGPASDLVLKDYAVRLRYHWDIEGGTSVGEKPGVCM